MSLAYTAESTSVFCRQSAYARGLSTSVCIQVSTSFSVFTVYSGRYEIFLNSKIFRPHLGPTQLPNECVKRAISLEVKRPGRDADPSSPSSVEVNEWSCTATALYVVVPCTWTTLPFWDNLSFQSSLGRPQASYHCWLHCSYLFTLIFGYSRPYRKVRRTNGH